MTLVKRCQEPLFESYKLHQKSPKLMRFCHTQPVLRLEGVLLILGGLMKQSLPRRAHLVLGEVKKWCPLCTWELIGHTQKTSKGIKKTVWDSSRMCWDGKANEGGQHRIRPKCREPGPTSVSIQQVTRVCQNNHAARKRRTALGLRI